MIRKTCSSLAILFALAPSALSAQGFTVSGRIGTLGLGAEGSLALTDMLAVRAGAFYQPWEPSFEYDGIDYTFDLASPSFLGVVDIHPTGGAFRFTGGLVFFGADTEGRASLVGPVEIGNETYTPQDIGTLTGTFATNDMAPYIGLGFGKAPGSTGGAFTFDIGVAFQGEPDVDLSATGPLASDLTFQADLAREENQIQEDAELFRYYPVISIGFVIGF